MAEKTPFDVAIIGSGPGGYVAAIRAAQLGMTVALIEKRSTLGGTCLNIGCIPSKALLDSTEFYARTKNEAEQHGIRVDSVSLDLETMMKRKVKVVKKFTGGVSSLMKSNGVKVFHGTGTIGKNKKIKVTAEDGKSEEVAADNIIIATGSVPQELPFLKFDGKAVIDSTRALELDSVPKKMVVVGAGAIGLELGSVWSRLGADVKVVEIMPEILPGFDRALAKTLRRELSKQGFEFHLETKVTGADKKKNGVTLHAEDKDGKEVTLEGDVVLVAVGRRPYTDGLGLEEAGIKMDDSGRRVATDRDYRTNVDGIYAIGDVIAGPMLAHKGEDEGIAVAEKISGHAGHVNYETIPAVVYTWPEAASVGKNEEELSSEGVEYRSGQFPFAINGRAVAMDTTAGFVKILADAKSDRILGAHILGPWASDLIAEVAVAMEFGGSAEDLARTVHAHPTLPEAVREAALAVAGRAIHGKS